MTTTNFSGVIPPVPTIIDDAGSLNEKGMANLIDFLIESGVDGLFFLGSGGEFASMSEAFRKQVAQFATKYVNGRVPVLIGTGAAGTEETIAYCLHAQQIGADGVVIINPYYYNIGEEDIYEHYAAIARNIELPIVLYNFPELTGQDLSPQLVKRLATTFENIVGIKETVVSVAHIREMAQTVKVARPDFSIFSGYDEHFLDVLALGGDGSIGATANFKPEYQVDLLKAYRSGDYAQAIDAHQKIAALMPLYKMNSTFMGVIKHSILLHGIDITTHVISPARPLSEDKKQEVKAFFDQLFVK